jgi:hypothetical protein
MLDEVGPIEECQDGRQIVSGHANDTHERLTTVRRMTMNATPFCVHNSAAKVIQQCVGYLLKLNDPAMGILPLA